MPNVTRYRTALSSLGHNLGVALVAFGVGYLGRLVDWLLDVPAFAFHLQRVRRWL